VDFEAVAQKVGIKYAKNARQSFRRVWNKMKSGSGGAAANGGNKKEANGDDDAESPKKPTAKKVAAVNKVPGELSDQLNLIRPQVPAT
jgi:hypothetical protein